MQDHLHQNLEADDFHPQTIVSAELEQLWIKELESRSAAFENGELEVLDGETVMEQLRNRFNR